MEPKSSLPFTQELQLVHVLRQLNPFHTLPTFFLISTLILSSNLCLRPYKWSHSFRSSHKNPLFPSPSKLATCPKNLNLLNLIIQRESDRQYKSQGSSLCNFIHVFEGGTNIHVKKTNLMHYLSSVYFIN